MICAACLAGLLVASACSSQPSAPEPAPAATSAAPAQRSSGDEGASLEGLEGDWVEYWALAGNADTQRYSLLPDGTFEWIAPQASEGEVRKRVGRYVVTAVRIELTVQSEELRGPCAAPTECVRTHEAPHVETLELAECPANDEARALDASYRCISLGGHVFWRRSP